MTVLDPPRIPGVHSTPMHSALTLVRSTKLKADQLRSELVAAEREHHEAVLAAANLVEATDADGMGDALFTVHEIADAAQCSRGRIYKRLGKPTYGDRSTAKAAYR